MIGLKQMRRRLIFSLVFFISSFFVATAFVTHTAIAQSAKDEIQRGACEVAGRTNCDEGTSTRSLNETIVQVVNILSLVVGIVAVIMIIYGGFRYITSAGDTTRTAAARSTILYAVIGLIIVALAQVIAKFVISNTR
jgi:cytochrome bd-type quinol oxidase subunit 2